MPGRQPLSCRLAASETVARIFGTNLLGRDDSKRTATRGLVSERKTFAHVDARSICAIPDRRSDNLSGTAPRNLTDA